MHSHPHVGRVDANGLYELSKHVVVEFVIEAIATIDLQDAWEHSILLSLGIDKTEAGFRLSFSAAYGVCGTIEAQKLSLRIDPGKPTP